jgi:outer membrane protein insertion porin family
MDFSLAFEIIVQFSRKKIRQFSPLLLIVSLSGCLGTQYLKENEKMLYRQSVKAPPGISTEGLNALFVQKPNRKFLGLPIQPLVWMHHQGLEWYNNPKSTFSKETFIKRKEKTERKFDRKINSANDPKKRSSLQFRKQKRIDALNSKIENGNLLMQWGEEVAVFDTLKMQQSAERLADYLFNKGYFLNHVTTEYKILRRQVFASYVLFTGPRYFYDTIIYRVPDTTVLKHLKATESKSLVKRGVGYDQAGLSQERERIDLMLKDRGYYDFSRQYIDFDVDTSYKEPHKIAVLVRINNPARRNYHKQFVVDSVSFTPDAGVRIPSQVKRFTREYNGITFNYFQDYYSERILRQRIFIYRDSLYSRSRTFETQRQLANLDAFRFVNVNYDTSGGRFIASIFSNPLDRYSWSNEAGVSLTQGFPGPYYSLSFKKRNIFRGLESFELTGRFGFEGVASATDVGNIYGSTEANVNASITFPQFLMPFSGRIAPNAGHLNPRTKFLGGYTYTDRPEYTRSIVTISDTYNWESRSRTQYSLTLVNLNVIRSRTDSSFNALLEQLYVEQGNNLRNSFKPSFVSSMLFSVIWNAKNYGSLESSASFLKVSAESGGTFQNFDALVPEILVKEGLELYKYVRVNLDFRRIQVLNKHTVVAARVNTGVGYGYSSNETLPYEKFFFVGGSNSIRAWRPRRLGIGTYPPLLSADPASDGLFDYRYERPGEILLESSIELRKKLFGFVNGAVFIDAGNVWSFNEAAPSTAVNAAPWTGSTKYDFRQMFRQLGIGTGFGLRFDFTFLVLRFDLGIKAYDPGREMGDRWVITKFRFWKPYGTMEDPGRREPVIYNVGIGYPF